MTFNIGDILEFPSASYTPQGILTGRYSVEFPQGMPGKWRVTAVNESGGIELEPSDEVAREFKSAGTRGGLIMHHCTDCGSTDYDTCDACAFELAREAKR